MNRDGQRVLSTPDASWALMLAQYTSEGRDLLTVASEAYKLDLLDQAQNGQMTGEEAGRAAGNIDGLGSAGAENAIWQANVDDADQRDVELQEAYADRTMLANAVKSFVGFGAGRDTPAGPGRPTVLASSRDGAGSHGTRPVVQQHQLISARRLGERGRRRRDRGGPRRPSGQDG